MYCLLYFLLKESLYSSLVCLFGPCRLHAVNHWCVLTHTCNYYTTAATVIGNKAISKSVLIYLLTYIAHTSLYLKQKYLKKLRDIIRNVILDITFWWKADTYVQCIHMNILNCIWLYVPHMDKDYQTPVFETWQFS